ncbi:hypothetical protein AB0J72_21445 [Dactylosporangium sp. NPDC049742]|uniref:hypothetical protein n=1 Tax=Dactylosporangium sp. NPDC049742 TaxID=3154737 RepID=UPI00341853EC
MPIPSRWRLLDYDTDAVIAECDDIDGLFTDRVFPVQPVYERYTLLGCTPEGSLRAAVDGTGPAWLGNIYLQGAHASCSGLANCRTCYETGEELLDVRVVGHTEAADGLLDVELEGHRRDEPNNRNGTVAPAVSGYRLQVWPAPDGSDGLLPAGDCRDVAGVFHERPDLWPPGPPLALLGCRAVPTGLLNAKLAHVRVDGTAHVLHHWVFGDVVATRPSALGDDLVDVELDARLDSPLSANERPLYDMWRAGGPAAPNQWAGLERSDRYLWVGAAQAHRIHAPDKPAGTVYHLDGRHVTDYDAFYCAIGEAINGPGGWFGGDGFWLHECAVGDAGATPGFRLVWHDAEVARAHLVPGYDRKAWREAITFDRLVSWLTNDGAEVELR